MAQGKSFLHASTGLPLLLAVLGSGALVPAPASARCTTSGAATTCTSASPNPWTATVGAGRNDDGRSVELRNGATIAATDDPAISLGDNATITLRSGSAVRGVENAGDGDYATGPNLIEFDSNGTLIVESGAVISKTGTHVRSEGVNVHGIGNRTENRGLIETSGSAALWFEDWSIPAGAAKNVVDNFGIIRRVGGGSVMGTSGGAGIRFFNETGARVEGDLNFAAGDDELYFFANSAVTGNISGGAGTDTLTLEGSAGSSDTLGGSIVGFETLTKDGLGKWTVSGSLTGFASTTVRRGTLALTGNNANYTSGVTVEAAGILEARAQSLPTQANPANNLGNIRNSGVVRFVQPDAGTYVGQIVGTGRVEKTGAGILTLAPSAAHNAYSGGTDLIEGTVAVASDGALGDPGAAGSPRGELRFNGGTLRSTATFSTARPVTLQSGGGTFETSAGTLTHGGANVIQGAGTLTKTGAGTLVLGSASSYTGGTRINGGILQAAHNANLGAAAGILGFDAGTLRTTASFTMGRSTALQAGGGTIDTQSGTLTQNGVVTGAGQLTKTGPGTLVLGGANSYAGGTRINAGVLQVSANANLGVANGPLSFESGTLRTTANVSMNRATTLHTAGGTFETAGGTTLRQAGAITGSGGLAKAGTGVMVMTGDGIHTGGTTIAAGTLSLGDGGTTGSLTGSIHNDAALVFNRSNAVDFAGQISGSGLVAQSGGGITRLGGANSYLGLTHVTDGALYLNGDQTAASGQATADAGTTLGGSGVIGGDVTIANGATLAPGDIGSAPGMLRINGDLVLGSGAALAYSFGQANLAGGPLNDLTDVGGDLTLDGTLSVSVPPGGAFGPGVYRVFNYGSNLTDGGLVIGTIPAPDFFVQTSVARQVNLVNTTGLTLNFWDGDAGPKNDGVVNGGDGTWQASAGNDNWTEQTGTANAPFPDGAFAIFTGTPGTVTVDAGRGAVTASGMQFAVDGYRVEGDAVELVGAPVSLVRVGDGTAAGAGYTATIASALTGSSQLEKTDQGTLVLDAANSHTGGTAISGGVLQIASDQNLGAASGALGLDTGTLRTTADMAMNRATSLAAGGGTFDTAAGTLTHAGGIAGGGQLTKAGTGTLVLDGANSHSGGTRLDGGVVQVGADMNLGAAAGALSFNIGTLRTTADLAMSRATTLEAGGGVFETVAGTVLWQGGAIAGSGRLTKLGEGTFVLSGTGSYTGGTTIASGRFQLGDGGATGTIVGDVVNDGVLAFNRSDRVDFAGAISGSGGVVQAGGGTTVLAGANSYRGPTTVAAGALFANGNQSGASGPTAVNAGATLGGIGTIGGDVSIAAGATLSPGDVKSPGMLRISGDLALSPGARLDYSFGRANVAGGPLNDLTEVQGHLTLDGTLDVTTSPGGAFDPGIYRVISYVGGLTDNGFAVGTIPTPSFFVQTSIPGQVNLINTAGLTLNFWDGDAGPKNNGVPDGGDGAWQSSAGNDNWTEQTGTFNAPFSDGAFAVFTGAPGTVSVDSNIGPVTASGMQFAVDGYRVEGAAIGLVGAPDATIRVGDGTAGGVGFTATIASALTGASRLRKTDLGTLVLEGANSYAGGTAIDAGVLQVASDANLGAASGGLSFDGGTLRTAASFATGRATNLQAGGGTFDTLAGTELRHTAAITGAGRLTKAGDGTLVLTGSATHSGGTRIAAGTLRLGDGDTSGSVAGDILNDAGLIFDRSDHLDHNGAISGSGFVRQAGTGTTVLGGANTYAGPTTVAAGVLQAGAADAFSAASAHAVGAGAALDLADFRQAVASLSNAGRVSLGSAPGTRLTVAGDYAGGGALRLATELGGDASPTDVLEVAGSTSGTTAVEVENAGGAGAATVEGIKVIDVGGASAGRFDLVGDFTFGGQPAVVAGAYGYTLQQNGVADPADGDWYLRSQLLTSEGPGDPDGPGGPDGPAGPILQPGVPIYQAYADALLALGGLPTMQERLGSRYWSGGDPAAPGNAAQTEFPSGALVEDRRAWARISASRSSLQPDVSGGGSPDYDLDIWQLQVGLDRPLHETGDGVLIGGASFSYGSVNADVSSFFGDGGIDTEAYGLGGSLTWLRGDGIYVDGQAQLTWFDSDLSSRQLGELASGSDGSGYAVGVEAGRRIELNPAWTVTPQGQLVYASVDSDDFTDPTGARVSLSEGAVMPARLGVSLDQERAWLDGPRGRSRTLFYGLANVYYDLLGETEVTVAETALTSENERLWASVGVGGSYSWNDGAFAVYGEGLVGSSLSGFGDNYVNSATFGFRTVW